MAQPTDDQDKAEVTKTEIGTTAKNSDKELPENSKKRLDEKLDEAVDETFPSSDPISVKITK